MAETAEVVMKSGTIAITSARIKRHVSSAVKHFWLTREMQGEKQRASGKADYGARSAVTGGAQMNGFVNFLTSVVLSAGAEPQEVFFKQRLELPGYYRPTKEWDLIVVRNKMLVAAIELKSQVGPSFGNNFNNRTEEAMGSALDIWTAFREGAFQTAPAPWLGYFFLLEDCPRSKASVAVKEPHFKVFPEFVGASYAGRYELFCRRLVRERNYNAATLILSNREQGTKGRYFEPATDLSVEGLVRSLSAQVSAGLQRTSNNAKP
jgi:hypothetical protein